MKIDPMKLFRVDHRVRMRDPEAPAWFVAGVKIILWAAFWICVTLLLAHVSRQP